MTKKHIALLLLGMLIATLLPMRPDKVLYTPADQIVHPSHVSRLSVPKKEWLFTKAPGFILSNTPAGQGQLLLETERVRYSLFRLITGGRMVTDWTGERLRGFREARPELEKYWPEDNTSANQRLEVTGETPAPQP